MFTTPLPAIEVLQALTLEELDKKIDKFTQEEDLLEINSCQVIKIECNRRHRYKAYIAVTRR